MDISKLIESFTVIENNIDVIEDRIRYSCILYYPDLRNESLDSVNVVVYFGLQSIEKGLPFTANLKRTITVHHHFVLNSLHLFCFFEQLSAF